MVIEDIERHKYNYRLLCYFLKKKGKYLKFKRILFDKQNRTLEGLFLSINHASINSIVCYISSEYKPIDRKWSAIFSYSPFIGSWQYNNLVASEMRELIDGWAKFLRENNYDKITNKTNYGNITFKFD